MLSSAEKMRRLRARRRGETVEEVKHGRPRGPSSDVPIGQIRTRDGGQNLVVFQSEHWRVIELEVERLTKNSDVMKYFVQHRGARHYAWGLQRHKLTNDQLQEFVAEILGLASRR